MADHGWLKHLKAQAAAAPMLQRDEERRLLRRQRDGDREALRKLVESHMRLVIAVAERYAHRGVPMEDLIGEGVLGLLEAARRFELERTTRFSTYAAWWVRAYVRRYVLLNRRIVPAPSTRAARRVMGNLGRTERELAHRTGHRPSRQQVAEALGVQAEVVEQVEAALSGCDVPVGPGEDGRGFEPPSPEPGPEQQVAEREEHQWLSRRIQQALGTLDEREREIVRHRLLCDTAMSLTSLGRRFGVSRERVRQLQRRAEHKLRSALQMAG